MNKRKLVISSGIANMFEWYDYALFGHFATLIGSKFFPESDPGASALKAFLVFAAGYLIRPIGGIFFGTLGDKFGRKAALGTAVVCMSFPTVIIGLLPTYETMGIWATVLMIISRMLQGLSMGGALTGSISFAIEHTSKKHRGIAGSVSMCGICLGILLGSLCYNFIKFVLSPEQFYSWGWRIPFLLGFFIIISGIYIRKNMEETPLFEEVKAGGAILRSPLKKVVKNYWFDMLMSIFINSVGSVVFYFQAIYITSFLTRSRGFPEEAVSSLATLCYVIMAFATLLVGFLSDLVGRRKIFVFNVVIISLVSFPLIKNLEVGNFYIVTISQIIFAILAAAYIAPEPALQAEFYPTNVRSTALSMSYNLATSIFGGTTPYVVESLVQKTGNLDSVAYYFVFCGFLSLIGLFFYKDRSKKQSG